MKLLIANWKMAPETPKQALVLAKATVAIAKKTKKHLHLVVCVPFVYLTSVHTSVRTLVLGAQDVATTTSVASTGKISAPLIKGTGATYCIVGHSETRALGDTNETVKEKVERLLEAKLNPILCVGEKERDSHGWYLSTVKDQIESALGGVAKPQLKRFVIAYEPVWAIGSTATREATPAECTEMIMFIRKILVDMYDEKTARVVSILYGGSVSEENAEAFVTDGGANGLLVGRVSLQSKRFAKLAERISI